MSIIPLTFRDWWDDNLDTPLRTSRLLDQHFGHGLATDDLVAALTTHHARRRQHGYNRPWHLSHAVSRPDSGSMVKVADDKFQINLDVQQFAPEEISVSVDQRSVTVEGKHEEKQDEHGYISRHFVRRYVLPADHDADQVVSSLSSDGILTVTAAKKALPEPKGPRAIKIVQTGKPLEALTEKASTGHK
ncbi:protein lethal(2)essential for life-like [Ochlerotatus camptorhynchus]|uniref:protein lethal(2)essential for life-like n=1 Tax=Ochlerotatus camptorhynchus TaxID=644619 RepID=UPI0031D35B13